MIEVIDLHKSFNGVDILRGIEFRVEKGEILALIGKSGHGKSVLLKHIVGLTKPDRGCVLIGGEDIGKSRGNDLERLRGKFGYLFQGGALFDSINVFENVAFPLQEKTRLDKEKIREKVLRELDQVGLAGVENKYPAELSGGMKKRVSLARCLCTDPEIMLFDEPTTGLDPVTARSINNLIRETHERLRFTGVIITHDIAQIVSIVQKIAVLNEGRIELTGTPEEIKSSDDPLVRQFFEDERGGPAIS
ncbi:MAG: ABC transporter ATP-binding protein [Deltaproteobacteria bacterium]|nr:ABC transporter ATP-binding protein [Deltaproteobacteria bacterium]